MQTNEILETIAYDKVTATILHCLEDDGKTIKKDEQGQNQIVYKDPINQVGEVSADLLVDPFGVVFDSQTGKLINGATVKLIRLENGVEVPFKLFDDLQARIARGHLAHDWREFNWLAHFCGLRWCGLSVRENRLKQLKESHGSVSGCRMIRAGLGRNLSGPGSCSGTDRRPRLLNDARWRRGTMIMSCAWRLSGRCVGRPCS